MLYASTRFKEQSDVKVFVDSTGRRKKMVMVFGLAVATFAALYMGVVAVSLFQAPADGLVSKATVSDSASPSTTKTAATNAR